MRSRIALFRDIGFLLIMLLFVRVSEATSPKLRSGSIGVIYVIDETSTNVDLKVVFPVHAVESYPISFPESQPYWEATLPISYNGSIVVFDDQGMNIVIDSPMQFKLVFWCENDGGTQYRPEARISVAKSRLARPLNPVNAIQSIAGFTIITSKNGTTEQIIEQVKLPYGEPDCRMFGRLTQTGPLVAYISVVPDAAENCDGEPANNLTITLSTAMGRSSLRCCGP